MSHIPYGVSDDWRHWVTEKPNGGNFAIALALLEVAEAIRALGNADAATPTGAIEALGKRLGEGLDNVAASLDQLKD